MLKAIVTSPSHAVYGVTFEHQHYGRTAPDHISVYVPCADFQHAHAVAKAYNGVAFTEDRSKPAGELPPHVMPAHDDVVGSQQYRGAPKGVPDYTAPDVTPLDALYFGICEVRLDDGGYAPDGVYWGIGAKLWHARATVHAVTVVSRWFRALSYAHAVQIIRTEYRNATTQRVSGEMTVKSRVVS